MYEKNEYNNSNDKNTSKTIEQTLSKTIKQTANNQFEQITRKQKETARNKIAYIPHSTQPKGNYN